MTDSLLFVEKSALAAGIPVDWGYQKHLWSAEGGLGLRLQ